MRESQKVIMVDIVSPRCRERISSSCVCCGIQCFHGGNELHPLLAVFGIHVPSARCAKGMESRKRDANPGRRYEMAYIPG